MASIIDEIKASFRSGSTLIKLIYINLAVFIVVKLLQVISFLSGTPNLYAIAINWLAVPASVKNLIIKPWTIISYQFLHEGFLHILFNLLILFWFGRIFLQYLDQKKLVSVYLLGGIAGAALFILAYNVFPVFYQVLPVANARGASAAVMAVVISISVLAPNYTLYLMFIGPVKLKYIALFYIVLDIISIGGGNAGGHIAHLGGALYGFLYIRQYKRGRDMSKGFNNMMDNLFSLFKPRKKLKVSHRKPVNDYEYNKYKKEQQDQVDRILDKISKQGYNSLTKSEKEILFKAGK
jgi:membrane associated rhomboid family serine protease